MLNKHGRGELYFGVKDNGNVIGQNVSDATLRQVTSWVSDKIEPAVFPTVECLDADDGLVRLNGPLYTERLPSRRQFMTAGEPPCSKERYSRPDVIETFSTPQCF